MSNLVSGLALMLIFGATPVYAQSSKTVNIEKSNSLQNSSDEQSALTTIVIELDMPSVAAYVLEYKKTHGAEPSRSQQIAHAKKVDAAQRELGKTLSSIVDITHVSNLRIGINGLKCRTDKANIERIERVSGVKAVRAVARHKKLSTQQVSKASQYQAMSQIVEGYNGQGVTIAIVDDGIDYTHKALGGSGDVEDYNSNDRTVIEPGTFPTAKVIGGYDLAGSDYTGLELLPSARTPDPDPLPGGTHGTNGASIAAGVGVPGVLEPGVAPGANLLAVKVFGDGFLNTDLGADGIEYALDPNMDGSTDDRADIINLSLGTNYGVVGKEVDYEMVIDMATQLGVVIVAAAGNSGDQIFVHSSPASYPDVISVGSVDGVNEAPKEVFGITAKVGEQEINIPARYAGRGDSALENISAVSGKLLNFAVDMNCQSQKQFPGRVLMLDIDRLREICDRDQDRIASYLGSLGASGILFYGVHNQSPLYFGDSRGFLSYSTVVAAEVDDYSRDLVLELLKQRRDVRIEFSSTTTTLDTSSDSVVSHFSSRGPSALTYDLKPDVIAPGHGIPTAKGGSGSEIQRVRGTSFSAPFVAGLAALVKQRFPDSTPAEVKSMILTTASPVYYGNLPSLNMPYDLSMQGLGAVDKAATLNAQAILTPAVASFGRLNPVRPVELTRTFTLRNVSSEAQSYQVSTHFVREYRGLNVRSPSSVDLAPGETKAFEVGFFFDPRKMPVDQNMLDLATVQGWLQFENPRETLRSAFFAAADPASALEVFGSRREAHHIINHGAGRGKATAYDKIFAYEFEPLDNPLIPGYKDMGSRVVEIDGELFYEMVVMTDGIVRDIFTENFSLLLRPYDPINDLFEIRYAVASAFNVSGLRRDLSGQSNVFSYFVDDEQNFKRNAIRPASIDYDDGWVKFLLPKEGASGLDQYMGPEGFIFMTMELVYMNRFDKRTSTFHLTGNSQAIDIIVEPFLGNKVDEPVLDLGAAQARRVTAEAETELGIEILWLFENNPLGQQFSIVEE